jgi:hypothetical protein
MIKEPLNLSHQQLLSTRFAAMQIGLSQYTFANCYLFRDTHAYEVVKGEDVYLIGKTRDQITYLMPTTSVDQFFWGEIVELMGSCDILYPIPEEWLSRFDPKQFTSTHLDRQSDYIYGLEKMRHYPGRALSSRRNLLHQFEAQVDATGSLITPERISDAMVVLETWHLHRHRDEVGDDFTNCKEGLELWDQLNMKGMIFYDGSQPIGIIIGEAITKTMFVIHFAKGDVAYKGIYPYMYQQIALQLDDQFEWINMEQDLGLAGLKQAKMAYQPDKMGVKLRVELKKG